MACAKRGGHTYFGVTPPYRMELFQDALGGCRPRRVGIPPHNRSRVCEGTQIEMFNISSHIMGVYVLQYYPMEHVWNCR